MAKEQKTMMETLQGEVRASWNKASSRLAAVLAVLIMVGLPLVFQDYYFNILQTRKYLNKTFNARGNVIMSQPVFNIISLPLENSYPAAASENKGAVLCLMPVISALRAYKNLIYKSRNRLCYKYFT